MAILIKTKIINTSDILLLRKCQAQRPVYTRRKSWWLIFIPCLGADIKIILLKIQKSYVKTGDLQEGQIGVGGFTDCQGIIKIFYLKTMKTNRFSLFAMH